MKIALFFIVTLFMGYRNENVDLVISNSKIINAENGSITLDHARLCKYGCPGYSAG